VQLLVCLASRPAEVIPRSEILDNVWSDVVVAEENLTAAISELRRILGDDAQHPTYIETIRKGGYRLVAPVEWFDGTLSPAASEQRTRHLLAALVALALVVAVLGSVAAWRWGRRDTAPTARDLVTAGLQAAPFTSFSGVEIMPAISPDGTRVAFAWSGEGGSPSDFDIYVKQDNTETPRRLTDSPGFDAFPAWSPDGTWVSYFHQDGDGSGIFIVPSLGGERRLLIPGPGIEGSHGWSTDGERIVYTTSRGLNVLEIATGTTTRLTEPPARCCGDGAPCYSPDGKTVSFIRTDGAKLHDVYLVDAGGGSERRLTRGVVRSQGCDWSSDGSFLLCSSLRGGRFELWAVDSQSGAMTPVPTGAGWAMDPSIARESGRVSFQEVDLEVNIWRYGPGAAGEPLWTGKPLIVSTRMDLEAAYSPDGRRIAFTSGRSGSLELWVCDADGTRPMKLTSFLGAMVSGPEWSPDGHRIAFTACPGDSCETYVVTAEGGPARALTDSPFHTAVSEWSNDGRRLYVASDRDGRWQIYAMEVDESSRVRQLTTDGGISCRESADGRSLYFSRPEHAGIWRIDLAADGPTEPESVLADVPTADQPGQWDVCRDGIVGLGTGADGRTLKMFRFDTNETVELGPTEELASIGISVSPDCGSVLIGTTEAGRSDLMMADIGTGR
jgi:Tol biopolymer transport system component